jgi:dipeptidyl aminopeptidase/acylaminoacyl peptidase
MISGAAWSPDGRRIALAASEESGDAMVNLWLLDADGNQAPRRLGGEDFELEPTSSLVWHPDGTRLAVVCVHRGMPQLAIVSIPDGRIQRIRRGLQSVVECSAWGERIAFVSASMRRLEEVHSIAWDGSDERRHSRLNAWFRKRARPHVSRRSFAVPDGHGCSERIRAWLLRPAQGKGPHPLLVDMHGGPHSSVLIDYSAHTYWYTLLDAGWAILAADAVGSSSYGRQFARRLRGRWGELDLPQHEAIVRALQREGIASDIVACAGKSYGGFLAAWAVGHSELFTAAAACAPVANMLSHFGNSDTGAHVTPWLVGIEFPDDKARWHAQSAVEHLHGARTPTLILQGEDDARCPRGQGEELFAHLIRYSDAPAELVLYPGSSHSEAESGRPSNRIDYHGRICRWFARWAREARTSVQEPRRAQG